MTKDWVSPAAFTVAFCCAYAVLFAMNWPLFLYYPLHGGFSWGWHVMKGEGPAMVWYGLMANATIGGLLAAVCLPNGKIVGVFRNYLWLFPCATMVTCVFLVRQFFV